MEDQNIVALYWKRSQRANLRDYFETIDSEKLLESLKKRCSVGVNRV